MLISDAESFVAISSFLGALATESPEDALGVICVQMNLQPNPMPGHEAHPVVPKREDVDEQVCAGYLSAILAADERLRHLDSEAAIRKLCSDDPPTGAGIGRAFDEIELMHAGNAQRQLNGVLAIMTAAHRQAFLEMLRSRKGGMRVTETSSDVRRAQWASMGETSESMRANFCDQLDAEMADREGEG